MMQGVRRSAVWFLAASISMMSAVGHAQVKPAPGLAGFSGQVRGKVVMVNRASFKISVREVVRVWKGNKAERPQMLRGRTVSVQPGAAGSVSDAGLHASFIRSLKSGQDLLVEIHNPEGSVFRILELNREQRDQAEAYEKKQAQQRGRVAEVRRQTEQEKLADEMKRDLQRMRNDGEELRNRADEMRAEIVRLREEIARLKEVIAETRR